MTELRPYMRAQLKAVISARTLDQISLADSPLASAEEVLGKPLTIVSAWAYPSDYDAYEVYAYVHAVSPSGDQIVRVGGNAGRQALWLDARGRLPSIRTLTRTGTTYFWKTVK